jgi:hypothetical protein
MRTISNLVVPQNTVNLPLGGIVNETDIVNGTPVIEEIYGDILSNLYRLLTLAGITPTNTQDNDATQYQLVDALQRLPNVLNDIRQPLNLSGTTWEIPLDIDNLPENYILFARAANDFDQGVTYTFEGSGNDQFSFTSSGFSTADTVMIVLSSGGVTAINLNGLSGTTETTIFPSFSDPISYNDTSIIRYNSFGALLNDSPSSANLIQTIRVAESNVNLDMINMFITNGRVLCIVYDTSSPEYSFFDFALSDLSISRAVSVSGVTPPTGAGILSNPVFYLDNLTLYASNSLGASNTASEFTRLTYDATAGTLTFLSSITFANYNKTTNGAIFNGLLYTLTNNQIITSSATTGVQVSVDAIVANLGMLFIHNSVLYFTTGSIAKRWFII